LALFGVSCCLIGNGGTSSQDAELPLVGNGGGISSLLVLLIAVAAGDGVLWRKTIKKFSTYQ